MENNLELEYIEVDELIPYEKNQRIHSTDQISKIANSIREFGFLNPIIVDENNVIVAGHGRLEGAKLLKMLSVPCVRAENLSQAQIKAYRIADNRLQDLSEFDEELLKQELELLQDEFNFDIELMGFDLDFLIEDEEEDEVVEKDDESSEIIVAVGSIKFEISEDKYKKWLNKVHKKVGKENESIEREVKARLGL
jgi:ParB-like chromosome segregation protein Spo0J